MSGEIRILLINVALRPTSPVKYINLGLAYVAAAIKNAGFELDILDIDAHRHSEEEISDYLAQNNYDVICMGCIVTGYSIIKKMARKLREHYPDVKIIVGNSVADSIPETLLLNTEVDIAVIGEGDVTIVEVLKRLEREQQLDGVAGIAFKREGEVKTTDPRSPIEDLSTIPFIDYTMWDVEEYIVGFRQGFNEPAPMPREQVRGIVVNTARGCVNRCTFCYHVFRNAPYRHRPWKHVLEEVKMLVNEYGVNYVAFHDELTFSTKKSIREFLDEMKKIDAKFFWTADCRGNLFNTEEDLGILNELKGSGCVGMGYALESSNPEILRAMNKNMTVEQFTFQTSLFRKAGIQAWTSLVFGYPQETPETIRDTIDCCIENRIFPSAGYLLPFPGSEMYIHAVKVGVIDANDEEEYLVRLGDRQDLRFNLTSMTDEELEKTVTAELRRCNNALGIGLADEQLTKTQYYRSSKEDEKGR